jgi:hypothetical protein
MICYNKTTGYNKKTQVYYHIITEGIYLWDGVFIFNDRIDSFHPNADTLQMLGYVKIGDL